jgi:hypothetical protein
MTENGDPYENAIAERVNGILKTEWLYDMDLHGYTDALAAVTQVIKIYNTERLHSSIEMLTPDQAHNLNGKLRRLWKSYKRSTNNDPQIITEQTINNTVQLTKNNFVNLYQD